MGRTNVSPKGETIGKEMQCIKVKSTISSIAVTPDGHMALVGSGDGILRLIDLESGKSNYLGRDLDVVWCVAVSPDGKRAISGGKDKTLLFCQS
jgi:WD40 repeat protein